MTVLPIVGRELRVAARGRAIYWVRLGIGLLAILIAAGIFVFTFGLTPEQIGRRMFQGLAGLIFLYCVAYGRRSTADCLSQEKREGTLGLLFLTDLKGHDVVLGKMAATSLRGFYGLLAVFPVLAVPLLLGGVTNGEFWRMVLVLVDTFLFSLAIGMLGSALSREFRRAMAANFILLLLLLGGLPAFAAAIAYFDPLHPLVRELFFACPAYAFYLCADATYRLSPTHFWWSVGTVHALTWLLVTLASSIVPRSWQDRPERARPRGWREFWRQWSYGNSAKQKEFRRGALDANAFYWLAARARLKPVHVWTFLGFMLGWWLVGWATSGHLWLDPTVAILTTLMLNGALKVWVAIEAGQELAEDQKAGAFELLLSSSLTVKDILRGQLLALRRQFFWPLLAVIAVELLFMQALHRRSLQPYRLTWLAGIFILVADICALSWVGMRNALTARSHNHATISTTLRVLMFPWALFGAVVGAGTLWYGLSLDQDWSPGGKFYVGLWFGLSLVVDLVLGFVAWRQLNTQFRQLALRRFNPRPESASGAEPSAKAHPSASPNASLPLPGKRATEGSPSPQPSPPGEGEAPSVARSMEFGLLAGTPDASAVPAGAGLELSERKHAFRPFARPALLVFFILLAASIGLVLWRTRSAYPPAFAIAIATSNAPVRVFPGGSGALLILPDGSLWRWGHPGLFGSSQMEIWQPIGTNRDWVQASGIYRRSFGLRSDGWIWVWDSRSKGAGDAQASFSLSAARDKEQTQWIAVEAGSETSTALRRDGTIWSWTNNSMSQTDSKPILTQVGTNDDWVAICGRWNSALGLKRDGTLWAWGVMPIVGSGQASVNLTVPTKLCRETNWAGFDMGFFPLVRTRSGEVWEPFHGSPDAEASAASVCRLLLTNSAPGRVATAICGRPMLYQIRADGTLWETTYDFGTAFTAGSTWRRVDKRFDWVSLFAGAGAAFGSTSDGMLWTWGVDFSRQAKPSVATRLKQIQFAIRSRFGSPSTTQQMGSMPPYNEQPQPLLRLVLTNGTPKIPN